MLKLEHLSRSFGGVRALDDLSLTVAAGEIYGLLGPNGAGKTTTLRVVLGIVPEDSGRLSWAGAPIDRTARRRFGYLPEERGLYGRMRVREQIAYFAQLHGIDRRDADVRARHWLGRLGIARYADLRASELSKGNQQRVQIACAAVHDPELLILDEPFSGLDPAGAIDLAREIRGLAADGTTLLLSSHQMEQLAPLCDRFGVLARGRLRAEGTLAALRTHVPRRRLRVGPDTPALRTALAQAGLGEPAVADGEATYAVARTADLAALARLAVAAAPLTRFEPVEPGLAEVFLAVVAAEAACETR